MGYAKEYPTSFIFWNSQENPANDSVYDFDWFRDFRSKVALWERYNHVLFISATLAKQNDTQITCSK